MSKISIQETINEIKGSIKHSEVNGDEIQTGFVVDRYRRHDHGGGSDGDDHLSDHEKDKDFQRGVDSHQSKLNKVKSILSKNGFKPNASFELGEKGHFSIEVLFEREKK